MLFDALIDELVQREIHKDKLRAQVAPREESRPNDVRPLNPKTALLLGGLMDAASTYTFLSNGSGTEGNPGVKFAEQHPWTMVPLAAGVGTGYHYLHKLLAKSKPKAADTLAGLVGGFQTALGARNFQYANEAGRTKSSADVVATLDPARPLLVRR